MQSTLLKLDLLSTPLPSFNIKGESEVRTKSGGLISLVILAAIFMFATLKLEHLLNKKSPEISTFEDTTAISNEDEYNVGENQDFQFAVGLTSMVKGVLNDPRYVKWIARVFSKYGKSFDMEFYPLHECGPSDIAKFYPVQDRAKSQLNEMLEKDALFCFDWQGSDLAPLYGYWKSDPTFRGIDLMAVPCQMRFATPDGTVIEPRDDCVWEKDEVIDYLGETIITKVYFNQYKFHQERFDEDRI